MRVHCRSDLRDILCAQAELNLFRLTHNRDPVPHLPTESMGFRHPAFEVFYNEANSAYKICDSSGEDNSCSNQFLVDYGSALSALT